MQRLRILFLMCVLYFCGGTGCTNPFEPIIAPKELFPLKVGNEWKYEVANYLPAFKDTLYRYFTIQVVGDTIINGKQHFVYNINGGIFSSSIIINLNDGVYVWKDGKYRQTKKYPVRLGTKYQSIIVDSRLSKI